MVIVNPDIEDCLKQMVQFNFLENPWLAIATTVVDKNGYLKVRWYEKRTGSDRWTPMTGAEAVSCIHRDSIISYNFSLVNDLIPSPTYNSAKRELSDATDLYNSLKKRRRTRRNF